MRIKITSMMARSFNDRLASEPERRGDTMGYPTTTWEGDIPDGTTLEEIFRMFNRVDETDTIPDSYRLPSMTSGDIVETPEGTFLCATFGWEKMGPPGIRRHINPYTGIPFADEEGA